MGACMHMIVKRCPKGLSEKGSQHLELGITTDCCSTAQIAVLHVQASTTDCISSAVTLCRGVLCLPGMKCAAEHARQLWQGMPGRRWQQS